MKRGTGQPGDFPATRGAALSLPAQRRRLFGGQVAPVRRIGLKRISRTGNVANLEGSIGGPAALKVCFGAVDLAQDLSGISLNLGVSGGAELATHIKFVPLDIVGYLACQVPWTEDRTLKAIIPEQTLPIKIGLARKLIGEMPTFDGRIEEVSVKLRMQPSPTALILQSTNLTLACAPLAGLINAVSLNLAPVIPELMGDFVFKQKAMDFSFPLQLPYPMIGSRTVKTEIAETARSIILKGSI